jgi:adenine-specific DNA-methyltransferase
LTITNRTDEDLLYEVLIKYGLPLALPIETIQLGQHIGFSVGMGSLIACFHKALP